MRKKITNEDMHDNHKKAIKGMHELSGDQFYGLYKFGNDVAGHDGKKQTSTKSDDEVSDKPFAYAYTDEEEAMIKGADPKAKKITSSKSEESGTVKERAEKLYKLADSLSKVNVATLSEEQVAERNAMVARLSEELKGLQGVAEGSEEGNLYAAALQKYPQLKRVDRETVINALNDAYEEYLMHYGYEGIGPDEESSMIDFAVKGLKEAVTKTDTGLKHTAKPGQYGTDDKEEKQDPELNKSQTSTLDKAFDVHWNKKQGRGRYGQVDVEESIEEQISTEAYDRLKKVFDFSDYKG